MCEYTLGCVCHEGDIPMCPNSMRRWPDRLPKSTIEKLRKEDDDLKRFVGDIKRLCDDAHMVMYQSDNGAIIIFDPDAEHHIMDFITDGAF